MGWKIMKCYLMLDDGTDVEFCLEVLLNEKYKMLVRDCSYSIDHICMISLAKLGNVNH